MIDVIANYRESGRYYADLTFEALSLEWRTAVVSVAVGHLSTEVIRQLVGVFCELAIRKITMPDEWREQIGEAIKIGGNHLHPKIKDWLAELAGPIASKTDEPQHNINWE